MSEEYKHLREIGYIKDFPGADIERGLIKIAIAKQDLFLLKALVRNQVWDENTEEWIAQTKETAEGKFTNIAKFGGTPVTGRDITGDMAKLQNLNITTAALRDALLGAFIPDASGLPKNLKDFYLKAVDITVESGHTWYIASGEELAATKVTNNGRIWNAGTVISLNGIYDGIGIYDGTGIYK